MHKISVSSDQTKSQHGGNVVGHKVLPLDKELLVFDSCWERENQIFCLSYGRTKTPQSRHHTQEVFDNTNWT